jgi:tripartite-type tricarboxylate transporter receptor subunit TctC
MPVRHFKRYASAAAIIATAFTAFCSPSAQAADFKGETIAIEIGYGPGGGYDTYGRVLARHYGRFIPGNPTVVPRNMPGAGSLRAANFIYNTAPKNGTELGIFSASTAMEPLMGNEEAKFDPAKFSWIGSMNQDISFCGVWQQPGAANSFQQMLGSSGPETVFGSSGPAAISHQHPLVLKNLLGARVSVISGYEGNKEVNLAMQRGEVNGACGLFLSTIKAQFLRDVQEGRLKLVIQMGPKTTNEFGPIPSVFDFVKSEDDRKVLELHFGQVLLGRPVAGIPNSWRMRKKPISISTRRPGRRFARCWRDLPTIQKTSSRKPKRPLAVSSSRREIKCCF